MWMVGRRRLHERLSNLRPALPWRQAGWSLRGLRLQKFGTMRHTETTFYDLERECDHGEIPGSKIWLLSSNFTSKDKCFID